MPAGDIATTKQFVNGQLGVDGVDLNQIIQLASIQPAFVTAQSAGSSPGDSDYLVLLSAGGSFYKLLYQNLFKNPKWVAQAIGLPLFNTIINGDMKVCQWGTPDTAASNKDYVTDHWVYQKSAGLTGVLTMLQQDITSLSAALQLPTGYKPRFCLGFTSTTAQASLAAGDFAYVAQPVELTEARKLFGGASSAQIYVYTTVAGTYTFFIQNAGGTQTYKQDFNVATPNTWTQLTMPNIPVFPSQASGWGSAETDLSYIFGVTFACGSTFQDAVQSTWSANNHLGSASTINLFSATSQSFYICIAQHEPGPVCTYFQDEPFNVTLARCQRYAVGLNATPLGMVNGTTGTLYDSGVAINMRAVPLALAGQIGRTYAVSSGNAGTVALQGGVGAAPSRQRVTFNNSGAAWTANAFVAVTCVLSAELI